MKIIHCADLHLDSDMTGNFSKEIAVQRKAELINTFERMLKYASVKNVDAIIIAGDLFDKEVVKSSVLNMFISLINTFSKIHFFYLTGNHDEDNLKSSIDIIPDNLHIFNEHWSYYKFDAGNFNIVISGINPGNNFPDIYDSLNLNENDFNVVTLHGQITETFRSGQNETISLRNLCGKYIDYLALGHIHSYKYKKLDSRGMYCYSGCLEGRGFDECGEHGFVLLDIDDNRHFTHSFIPFAYRSLYELDVDVTGCHDSVQISQRIDKQLTLNGYESKSLIKINLTGMISIDEDIDMNYLYSSYKDNYYYLKIYNQTKFNTDYLKYINNNSLKGEFIRIVSSDDTLDDDTKSAVIKQGIELLVQ